MVHTFDVTLKTKNISYLGDVMMAWFGCNNPTVATNTGMGGGNTSSQVTIVRESVVNNNKKENERKKKQYTSIAIWRRTRSFTQNTYT